MHDDRPWCVMCHSCGIRGPWRDTAEEAVEAWGAVMAQSRVAELEAEIALANAALARELDARTEAEAEAVRLIGVLCRAGRVLIGLGSVEECEDSHAVCACCEGGGWGDQKHRPGCELLESLVEIRAEVGG